MNRIELLHGSDHIIEIPDIALGSPYNDYGKGFYCTRIPDMAGEWACKQNTDGFINRYELDIDGLKILNLMDSRSTVLNWMALLLKNRTFRLNSEIAVDARNYIIDNFLPNVSEYDIVIGYRADDSYFQYAESFVENTLPLRSLNAALRLGMLGEQTVLVSQEAFSRLHFSGAETAARNVYYPKFIDRDESARKEYREEIRRSGSYRDDIFVLDILREEMANDDPRIQRILSE